MAPNAHRGPTSFVGPHLLSACLPAAVLLALALLAGAQSARALDWIPPQPVTALLPSATFAPGSTHVIELTVRANGAPASLHWLATRSGPVAGSVTPAEGFLNIAGDGVTAVNLTVTVPDSAGSLPDSVIALGSVTVELFHQTGGGRAAKVTAGIHPALYGAPEVWPLPGTLLGPAGSTGAVSFQIHSMIATSENLDLTTGRFNPDVNNQGTLFGGGPGPSLVTVPGGATLTVSVPTIMPVNAYGGNYNAIQMSISAALGVSDAVGSALVSSPLAGSLPTALYPAGLAPVDEPATGRDGAAFLAARGYWLVPSGISGVRVMREASTDSIGIIDGNGDGGDDRWVGTVRIPSYAAAISVIPEFVAASGETLDIGLLAAGRAGLMLLDLRILEDSPFGSWGDFFDVDGNGVDDRILRTIPLPGYATDVAWFRAASGRVVALIADADTGSAPVSSTYDPALVTVGTGQGVVAIDVAAALDSIANPPFAAGALPTPGSTLDLELRGGSTPDLAIADGSGGVAVYALSAAAGVPASVTFSPRGTVALSSAPGIPYARDLAWVPNTGDSNYIAVAAGAAGVQIVRIPHAGMGAPILTMVQQTLAPAVGIAGAWTGTLGVALGSGGVALMSVPGAAILDRIAPAVAAPYTAPIILARGAAWAATGSALEVAAHQSASSGATSLCFKNTAGPIPDLLVSDGVRFLVLRPGQASITAVEVREPGVPGAPVPRLTVSPNPSQGSAIFGVGNGRLLGSARIEIYDSNGRLIQLLAVEEGGGSDGSAVRVAWDGRDARGRLVASGRYWARLQLTRGGSHSVTPLVILR